MEDLRKTAVEPHADGGFGAIMSAVASACASGRTPTHRLPVRLAGKLAELVVVGDDMADDILPLFAHMAEPGGSTAMPDRTIAFLDAEAARFGPPPIPPVGNWQLEGDGWRISAHAGSRYLCEARDNSLICLDRATGSIAVVYRSARGMTLADRGRPLQRSMYQLCLTYGAQNVHAGLVARNGVGALIVGARGRGKTTTSLDCFLNGLDLLGDDSVAIAEAADGRFQGYSLYGSARVFPGQIDRWPDIKADWRLPAPGDDKAMLHPGRIAGERMKSRCDVALILVPRVTKGAFKASRISGSVAFTALVHESEETRRFKMGPAEFHQLARLTRQTPCMLCELDADPKAVAAGVAEVIDRFSG